MVEVSPNRAANVRLMDGSNFSSYRQCLVASFFTMVKRSSHVVTGQAPDAPTLDRQPDPGKVGCINYTSDCAVVVMEGAVQFLYCGGRALLVGFATGAVTLAIGQISFAMVCPPVLRALIAVAFAIPAAAAGFHAVLGLSRIGVALLVWLGVKSHARSLGTAGCTCHSQ